MICSMTQFWDDMYIAIHEPPFLNAMTTWHSLDGPKMIPKIFWCFLGCQLGRGSFTLLPLAILGLLFRHWCVLDKAGSLSIDVAIPSLCHSSLMRSWLFSYVSYSFPCSSFAGAARGAVVFYVLHAWWEAFTSSFMELGTTLTTNLLHLKSACGRATSTL